MAQDLNNITSVSKVIKMEFHDFNPSVYERLGVYTTEVNFVFNHPKDSFMSFDNIVIARVVKGWLCIELNMQQVKLEAGQILMVHKSSVARLVDCSSEYEANIVMVNGELFAMASTGVEVEMLRSIFSASSIVVKDSSRFAATEHIFSVLSDLYACSNLGHNREVAVMMVRSLIVLCSDELAEQGLSKSGGKQSAFSSADVFFRNFVALLDEHVKTEHEVSFYAEQLKITPKYLNEMVRRKSQYKAKEVISGFLVGRIKSDLLTSGKSIKTIAYEYNFSDQSSFGKFFKKETGMSPLMFRQLRGIKEEE